MKAYYARKSVDMKFICESRSLCKKCHVFEAGFMVDLVIPTTLEYRDEHIQCDQTRS